MCGAAQGARRPGRTFHGAFICDSLLCRKMDDALPEKAFVTMTAAEFFAWQAGQTELYELVDGIPIKMMTGASNRHDLITVNIIGEARSRLRGNPCRPMTQDSSVKISETQIRRPDVTIVCGPIVDDSFATNDPRRVRSPVAFNPPVRSGQETGEPIAKPRLRADFSP